MAVKAGERYAATVMSAHLIESLSKGTPGIEIVFETADGQITHTIWITEKTVPRARKDLVTMGADEQQLESWVYLENIGQDICGHIVDITTFEEEYKGKTRVKVQWVNEQRKHAGNGPKPSKVLAAMFGGGKEAVPEPGSDNLGITDDDVPF